MNILARWAAISMAASAVACSQATVHPFSVQDDIAMVRFNAHPSGQDLGDDDVALRSPDGKHSAVVTTRGLLAEDELESTISVFDVADLTAFLNAHGGAEPKRRIVAQIRSFPHREDPSAHASVIKDLRWSNDGRRFYFKGESLTGAYRLYVASLDGKRCQALTPASESVGRYDVAQNLIAYTSSKPEQDHRDILDRINPDAQSITGHSLSDVLFSDQLTTIRPETFKLSVLSSSSSLPRHPAPQYSVREIPYLSSLYPFSLSPKGDKLIAMTPVKSIPDAWQQYEPASGTESLRFQPGDTRSTDVTAFLRAEEYALIDLKSGAVTPLIDGPNGRVLGYTAESRAVWSVDEKRVLVTNVFLSLAGKTDAEAEGHNMPCAVASVDLPSRETSCLLFEQSSPTNLRDLAFGATNDEVEVSVKSSQKDWEVRRYRLSEKTWNLSSLPARPFTKAGDHTERHAEKELTLTIRQSLNEPPVLWVSDQVTGRARAVWDPNPQFQHVSFGQASPYQWKDSTGYEWSGVLLKPVGYIPGRQYPLVIQLYQFAPNEFMTDGLYPTAFAARELASAGFMVLQVRKKPSSLSDTDPQDHLEAYRSAIEHLDQENLIDRSRVGVVGFSWTCWYALNALIKDPHLFAAATIADGIDNSYLQYMLFAPDDPAIQAQMEEIRVTKPFGDGLTKWTANSPGFHTDQIQSPVRLEAIGPLSVLQEWELYASLRLQHKPVDLIYFPTGTHIHQRPLERLESQQGNVDWFRFWLQGYENPDPSKAQQYERWRTLRAERNSASQVKTQENQLLP